MPPTDDDETTPIDPSKDDETTLRRPSDASDETVITDRARGRESAEIRRIGRYRLVSQLGQGGQGAVYLAEDERIRRKVALKILFGGLVHSTEARLRFEREAEATGRLNHPGIARIYEMDEAEGVPFIAMELIEGEPLSARLKEAARAATGTEAATDVFFDLEAGEPSSSTTATTSASSSRRTMTRQKGLQGAARFIEHAARALHVAHEAGLVHRDIKPGNIMVRTDGSPCILDFGLAHDDSSAGMTLTGSRDRFGTPSYMAPEQVRGQTREIDRRTDVWALGATLYECCTLKRPFEAPTLDELFELIKNEEPRPPRNLNPRIPKDLEAVILTALDKDQNRRYATAEDLAEDLRRFSSHEPVLARPAGKLVKGLRWVQRNRGLTAATLLVFVALITTTVVFFVKEQDAQRALADRTRALKRESAARAAEQAALEEKSKALDDYDRLADVKRLESAIAASEELYPPGPELVSKLLAWQEEYGPLAERISDHETFLGELRARAEPYTEAARRRDFAKELAEIAQARQSLQQLDEALAEAGDDETGRKALMEQRVQEEKRLDELEERTRSGRRSWRFADQARQFQHDVMAELLTDLKVFAEDARGPVKSVVKRIEQARAIAQATLEGECVELWSACRERITKNEVYAGLDLEPQLGLIPLGPDPDSRLEEFLHWLTHEGEIPERDEKSGKIAVTDELGVVLVLIPGGTFLMGSQKEDPKKPNFDPNSDSDEQPIHEVRLSAYFLSKYEMTQAQWLRAFGSNPSDYGAGANHPAFKAPSNVRHPVERVSWEDAQLYLPRLDLQLPTEAEWERAARGGRTDQVFAGFSEVSELRRFANINGLETKIVGFTRQQPGHQDDWIIHAPVGSLAANAFGLHDMTGNVWELCLDGYFVYVNDTRDRGLSGDPGGTRDRVQRGGSFSGAGVDSRVADRNHSTLDTRASNLGLRPARIIP